MAETAHKSDRRERLIAILDIRIKLATLTRDLAEIDDNEQAMEAASKLDAAIEEMNLEVLSSKD